MTKERSRNEKSADLFAGLALVVVVLVGFDDIVFRNLNQILAGLPTGIPNRDSLVVLFPFFENFIDSIREGGLDPWNPYIWGGSPAIGNPNIPFNLLLYFLFHLPKSAFVVAMNWHLVAEFSLAAVGMFVLGRHLQWKRWAAFLAAILYVSSTSAMWMTNTFCIFFHWVVFPWALWILMTAPSRSIFRSSLLLAVLFYYQLTYGQAQMTLYSWILIGLCLFWILREHFNRRRASIVLAGGLVAGIGLALHFLLPMLEYMSQVPDRATSSWAETALRYRVDWRYLVHLFLPRLFWDPLPWWPAWRDGWSAWESFNASVGAFFGLVAFWAFVTSRDKVVRRFGALAVALVVLSTTEGGGRLLVALNLGRTVPYSRITHLLLIPMLFAIATEIPRWLENRRRVMAFSVFLLVVLGGGIALSRNFGDYMSSFFASAARAGHYSSEQADFLSQSMLAQFRLPLAQIFFEELGILAVCAALLAASCYAMRLRPAFLTLAVALPLATQLYFFQTHRQRGTEAYPFSRTLKWDNPLTQALEKRKADFDQYLFSTFTGRMELDTGLAPNQNASLRIPSVNGYTSFNHHHDARFHRGNWGFPFSEEEVQQRNIKYILLGPETPSLAYRSRLKTIATYKEYRLVEYLDAVPQYRFQDVPSNCMPTFARTAKGSEVEIALTNPCDSAIRFSIPKPTYPWWKISLNERELPVPAGDYTSLDISLTPGTHKFRLRCWPIAWYLGLGGSFAFAFVLCGMVIVRARSGERKKKAVTLNDVRITA